MNAHIQPFYQGGKYFSFYPYYLPKYYSNYYPRHYNRYYEPVSTVNIKKGPVYVDAIPEPKAYQYHHFMIVAMLIILFIIATRMALK